ncbi:MAG: L-2-hydroxyglutarate oxidase [Chloroflexi bacterium]|nr:L-2-hydroxyglutarate oxidase [Chloroflexota bacterium]
MRPQPRSYDVAIVGAGILGLATAYELHRRDAGLRIVVVEKERAPAAHQTGHNSGVIHSGIYYRPGSEKARLCVEGRRLLLEHLVERQIPFELCGKLIVALAEDELPRLRELEERAKANGIAGVEWIDGERIREIEPHARGVAALRVPAAGIVDYTVVAQRLAGELANDGVELRFRERVVDVERTRDPVRLRTTRGVVEADRAVACAGLHSDRLARLAGAPSVPRIVPFRGDYYLLRPGRSGLVRGLIYPVPDPRFPFLGIHFTRRIDGAVWLGPNAVLALAREGYRRTDFDPRDLFEAVAYRGFQRLAAKYWRTGAGEMVRDLRKSAFLTALQAYVPELTAHDLLPGPSGVRAQAVGAGGEMLDDFAFDTIERLLNVRNAPSPAATSALALARVFADRLDALD